MEKHILICGERGVGKSTLIRRLLAESTLPVGGFVTRRLPQADGDGMFPIYLHAAALPPEPTAPCALRDCLCKDVFLIKLTPGLNPEIFDMLLQMHYRGVVIEAFGAGGLHFIRRDLISKLHGAAQAGMTVVVCSQCLYESSDFTLYQAGQKALAQGVLQGWDMTTEAAVTKLMWVLGQTDDPAEIRDCFSRSLCGEVSTPN